MCPQPQKAFLPNNDFSLLGGGREKKFLGLVIKDEF